MGIGFRQLAAIDRTGRTAWFHGDRIASIHNATEGEGCVAIGNIIRTKAVTDRMVEAFASRPHEHLAERLMMASKPASRRAASSGRKNRPRCWWCTSRISR